MNKLSVEELADNSYVQTLKSLNPKYLVLECLIFHPVEQRLKLLLCCFPTFFSFLTLIKLHSFFGNILEPLPIKLGESLNAVFIHRLREVNDFIALLQKSLNKRRRFSLQD